MSTAYRPRSKRPRLGSYTSWIHPNLDPAQRRYLNRAMAGAHEGKSTLTPAKRNLARVHFLSGQSPLDVPYDAQTIARALFPREPGNIVELVLLGGRTAFLRAGVVGWIEALK